MNLTREEYDALFRSCSSAERLETGQVYNMAGEAEELRLWREGKPLPEYSVRTSAWLREVAQATIAGKQFRRVHIVRSPLTEYLWWELWTQRANVAVGEEIWVADADSRPELGGLTEDFWAFDLGTEHPVVVWMRYDQDGRIVARERSDDSHDIQQCRQEWSQAFGSAVPLEEFMAAREIRQPQPA